MVEVVVGAVLVGCVAALWLANRRWPEVGRWRDVRRDLQSWQSGQGLYQDVSWFASTRWRTRAERGTRWARRRRRGRG